MFSKSAVTTNRPKSSTIEQRVLQNDSMYIHSFDSSGDLRYTKLSLLLQNAISRNNVPCRPINTATKLPYR